MTEQLPAWVHIEGEPGRRFALRTLPPSEAALIGDMSLPIHPILQSIGAIRQSASIGGSIENASVTVTLANANGEATALLATPPIGKRAHVYAVRRDVSTGALAPVREFSGVVTSVQLEETATIQVQA